MFRYTHDGFSLIEEADGPRKPVLPENEIRFHDRRVSSGGVTPSDGSMDTGISMRTSDPLSIGGRAAAPGTMKNSPGSGWTPRLEEDGRGECETRLPLRGCRGVQPGPARGQQQSGARRPSRAQPCPSKADERPRAAHVHYDERTHRRPPSAPSRAPDPTAARSVDPLIAEAPARGRDRRCCRCSRSCLTSIPASGQPANACRSPRILDASSRRPRWSRDRTVPIAHPAATAASW